MKVIGITGGVGAGKSEILSYIRERYNCRILLADEAAHKVKEKGQPCYEKLVALLSDEILDETGNINKVKMAEKIFSSRELLTKVNGIIHPAVKKLILSAIQEERKSKIHDFFFIEAALLIEEHYDEICDELWYIYTSEKNRRERLKLNRGYSDEKIDNIFASQLSESTYREVCREEIDNNHLPEDAFSQIDALMKARQVEKVQKRQTTEE